MVRQGCRLCSLKRLRVVSRLRALRRGGLVVRLIASRRLEIGHRSASCWAGQEELIVASARVLVRRHRRLCLIRVDCSFVTLVEAWPPAAI